MLSNAAGSLELGVGADFDFGRATDPNLPPEGLILQPVQLGNITVLNIPEPEDEDGGDEDAAEDSSQGTGAATRAPQRTPSESQSSTGLALSGNDSVQETTEVEVNPNELSGDGTLACTLNSNAAACRPVADTDQETEPEPEP
ncbi:MAG: hypothetical protein O2948_12390, partial [Proteobacteria bacterium]|nr:hypothetical protein [Pseudomonadota bacterium]